MSENITEQDWVFGYYTFDDKGKQEYMVWFPDGEAGAAAHFDIMKNFRNLVIGASYKVHAVNTPERTSINGTLPVYECHQATDTFRLKCEAENVKYKRAKARKLAETKVRKMDLDNMRLIDIKEVINKAAKANKRTREAMTSMVTDYLNGIAI